MTLEIWRYVRYLQPVNACHSVSVFVYEKEKLEESKTDNEGERKTESMQVCVCRVVYACVRPQSRCLRLLQNYTMHRYHILHSLHDA